MSQLSSELDVSVTRTHLPRYWPLAGLVIAAAFGLYMTGAGPVSLWDRDEPWYAQTSREMLRSGDWVIPRFLGQPRTAKPILIYWCQAASMKLFGDDALGARLPSAVGMTCTLILLAIVVRKLAGDRIGLLSVLVFATSAMVIVSAKMCLTDAVMLLFITGGQMCLYAIYVHGRQECLPHQTDRNVRHTGSLLLWVCVGVAGLAKGPFGLLVLVFTAAVLAIMDRRVRWWLGARPVTGLGIAAAIVAPWLVLAYLREPAFVRELLWEPARHYGSDESGGQFPIPLFYLTTIWAFFFPWSLFLPAAIVYAWKNRRAPHVRFAMATVIGTAALTQVMTTKLPHYLLPAYSSLALLVAGAIESLIVHPPAGVRRILWIAGALIWAGAAIGFGLLPLVPGKYFADAPRTAALMLAGLAGVYGASVLALIAMRRFGTAGAVMGGGMVLVIAVLFGLYLPAAKFLRLPQEIGERLRAAGATDAVMTGFAEPSLAFYQGGTIRQRPADWLTRSDVSEWPAWIVVSRPVLEALPGERRERLEAVATYRGFYYNSPMGVVEVCIVRKKEKP